MVSRIETRQFQLWIHLVCNGLEDGLLVVDRPPANVSCYIVGTFVASVDLRCGTTVEMKMRRYADPTVEVIDSGSSTIAHLKVPP